MSCRWMVLLLLLATPALCGFDPFRSSNTEVEEGNAKLGAGKIKEALKHYERAAKELPDEPGVHYNLGIALHRLGQLDRAREALLKGTMAQDPGLRAKSLYNLGNVHYEQKRYPEAVAAYRRALGLTPGHRPSKWNLELALRRQQEEKKKKKEEEKKKDQQKDQKKDQKEKKDQQDQKDQKDQQKQAGKQGDKGKQKPQAKKNPPPGKKQEQREKPMDREMRDAMNALDRNDRNIQRQRARMMGAGIRRPTKDW